MYKLFISIVFVFTTFLTAAEDTYVFEAKGAFAEELKSLVEKYSKEGKIEAKVYKKEEFQKTESQTITASILSTFSKDTADELKYADIEAGKKKYLNSCIDCHGANADDNKYASGRKLSTLTPIEIVDQLEGYQSNYEGDFGGTMRFLMKPQADNLNLNDKQSVAVYIYSIKNGEDIKKIKNNEANKNNKNKEKTSYLK